MRNLSILTASILTISAGAANAACPTNTATFAAASAALTVLKVQVYKMLFTSCCNWFIIEVTHASLLLYSFRSYAMVPRYRSVLISETCGYSRNHRNTASIAHFGSTPVL